MERDAPGWAHVISTYRGHWLPGDERGFRSRGHRVHSSGSYRQPPPLGEHERLRQFAQSIAGGPVFLNKAQQQVAMDSIVEKLERMEVPIAAGACDPVHCHVLIRVGTRDAKLIFGRAKQLASFRLRHEVPGKLWEGSSGVFRVESKRRFWEVVAYIRDHASHGAWVWVNPKLETRINVQTDGEQMEG